MIGPYKESNKYKLEQEIATLRAQVAALKGPDYDFGACVRQVLEIDRLRAKLAEVERQRDLALEGEQEKACARDAALARVAQVERERDEARLAILGALDCADTLNFAASGGAGFVEHWGERVMQVVEPLRNVGQFHDQTLDHNRVLLEANGEFLTSRDAALARVGVLEAALRGYMPYLDNGPCGCSGMEPAGFHSTRCLAARTALSSPPPHDGAPLKFPSPFGREDNGNEEYIRPPAAAHGEGGK